ALWLLSRFSKVTRCKSETISSRDRSNGYVHPQKTDRLTQSLREQASLLQKADRLLDDCRQYLFIL
ncbi:hypothetical protein, partial [Pseudomonas sp. FW300-N2A2]|uniref:hypothetical protein n=1 Tax=Pseudomonas sp. FW300-N2A2 TaxID=2751316 RepID=UPI001A92060F